MNADCIDNRTEGVVFDFKVPFACLGVATTLLATVILLHKDGFSYILYRLFLYVVLASMFQGVIQVLDILPPFLEVRHGYDSSSQFLSISCIVLGYLDQVACWLIHLYLCWLLIYILHLIKQGTGFVPVGVSKKEIMGIVVCLFIPFVVNAIPFYHEFYGFAGSWCWIKQTQAVCNNTEVIPSAAYLAGLYYGPLIVVAAFILSACCIILNHLMTKRDTFNKKLNSVILFPFCYGILLVIAIFCRLYATVRIGHGELASYKLIITHAIVDTLRITFPTAVIIAAYCCTYGDKIIFNNEGVARPVPFA